MYRRKEPKKHYPRCHYSRRKRKKKAFETLDSAEKYINDLRLIGYTTYICPVCCKWHIGHNKDEQT